MEESATGETISATSASDSMTSGGASTEPTSNVLLEFDESNGVSSPSASYDERLYKLHHCTYEGDIKSLSSLLVGRDKTVNINLKDRHGNTALHIAAMLGRSECVELLVTHGAQINTKNNQGQTALNEAVSYGNREIIMSMLHSLRKQTREAIDAHQPEVESALNGLDDFELTLKWEFHSWVPLVSRFLPCDTCHIYKKGCRIRMDSTLIDFKDMKWERGDLSFMFDGKKLGSQSLLVMDNEAKVYQWIRDQSQKILASDVDMMMRTDNETGKLSTKDVTFSRAHSGIIFKEEKTEMIGSCMANYYNVNGIKVISVKRREHLTDEDVKANKIKLDHSSLKKTIEDPLVAPKRESLPPPILPNIPWKDYWSAPAGRPPCIGRPLKCKRFNKAYQASVAMSSDFPVTVEQLLTILESIKPLGQFKKLKDFLTCKLPPGFPVKLEIPVFPTVTAKVSFERFAWRDDLDDKFFQIPSDYKEDNERFADL